MAEIQFDPETEHKLAEIQQKLGVSGEKALQLAIGTLHGQCDQFKEWLADSDPAMEVGTPSAS